MSQAEDDSLDPVEIAQRILARRSEGIHVPFVKVGMRNDDGTDAWLPRQHYCHDNVAAWVFRTPTDKAVRGYVIFDLRIIGCWRVAAHTVIESGGVLMDITPSGASQPYPFVRHVGTEEEFATIARAIQVEIPADQVP